MTLYQIIRRLETFALTLPNVRTASDGDVYDGLNDNPELKYGVFFITQNTHQEFEDMDRYGLTLFYIDRLDDTLEDNRLQIQSIGKEIISVILRDFCEEYDIDLPTINYTPFTQKFKDETAGVYAQLTIDIIKGICADDFSEIINIYQTKTVDLVENGQFTVLPDSNYPALDKVIINVDVQCSGCTEEELQEMYDSGYTEGYNDGLADCGSDYDEGYADGIAYQKSLLSELNAKRNGNYQSEDGWWKVEVRVPQSGHTDEELDEAYQSGITYQKSLLSGIYITENGQYNRIDGYSSVTVNVPQSGYTQEDLDNAYNRGYQDGLDACGEDYSTEYLTIKALSSGTLYWNAWNSGYTKTIEYSKNDGEWTSVTSTKTGTTITTVQTGDKVRLRGLNETYCDFDKENYFGTNFRFRVYGNIMSLIYGDNFNNQYILTAPYSFRRLFSFCSQLIDAENLILPATALTTSCYDELFYHCNSLITAPELPSTSLAIGCYGGMFQGCTSLVSVPELPATTLVYGCYDSMFYTCTNLTTSPELPAITLTENCYRGMFYGCTNLHYVKCLATTISATNCTLNWLENVASTGTFLKDANATWTTGNSGIPTGWTVIDNN